MKKLFKMVLLYICCRHARPLKIVLDISGVDPPGSVARKMFKTLQNLIIANCGNYKGNNFSKLFAWNEPE
jgi:hypothetical protein